MAATTADDTPTTVTVIDAIGEVTVPVTDTGVYALDESAAIGLLTLGVQPIAVEAFFLDDTTTGIFEAEGLDVVDAGSIEAIAAAQPELIIGIGHPTFLSLRPEHEGIAPTVTPDFTAPWTEQTDVFAAVTGTTDQAAAVTAAVDARIAELRAALADAGYEGAEASVIQTIGTSDYFAYGPTTLAGSVLEQLGFTRSELQSTEGDFGFIAISPELLADETDADVVFAIAGSDSGGTSVFDSPTVDVGDTPSAVVTETWFQNHALAAWLILDDIEAVLLGDGQTRSIEDMTAVWSDLIAAIEGQS